MEHKETYYENLKTQLHEWEQTIETYTAKAHSVAAEAQGAYRELIYTLQEKRDAAEHKLQELQEAGEDTWEIMRADTETILNDWKQAVEEAKEKLDV